MYCTYKFSPIGCRITQLSYRVRLMIAFLSNFHKNNYMRNKHYFLID
nr:MAG TPA: hypothetical protein [Caudoviricetes sp.]